MIRSYAVTAEAAHNQCEIDVIDALSRYSLLPSFDTQQLVADAADKSTDTFSVLIDEKLQSLSGDSHLTYASTVAQIIARSRNERAYTLDKHFTEYGIENAYILTEPEITDRIVLSGVSRNRRNSRNFNLAGFALDFHIRELKADINQIVDADRETSKHQTIAELLSALQSR